MDFDNLSLKKKCENLMNMVVESRKQFGKISVDYGQKALLIENKLLELSMRANANCHFRGQGVTTDINIQDMSQDINSFREEVTARQQKIYKLTEKIKNTKEVVFQLQRDNLGRKLKEPISTEVLIANAKNKS